MKLLLLIIIFVFTSFAQKKITIVYTNDIHGHIDAQDADYMNPEFPPHLGGGASAYKLISKLREDAKRAGSELLIFDSGDMFQGTAIGMKNKGKTVIEYMNKINYTAAVAGNHDFDLGKSVFTELSQNAKFPILACNIIDKSTGEIWDKVKPYEIKDLSWIKIGIIGVATEATENMAFEENIKGLDFVAEKPAVEKYVKILKEEAKVDLIIVLAHLGLPFNPEEGFKKIKNDIKNKKQKDSYLNGMELIHYVSGIDLFFGGHIHIGYRSHWEDPKNHTLAFQNYGNGGNIGIIDIILDEQTKTIIGTESPKRFGENLVLLETNQFERDAEMAKWIDTEVMKAEKGYEEVIGETKYALTRSNGDAPMMNLVTDAMRDAGKADFAFTNFGGIRANLKSGVIRKRDVLTVLPFGNQLIKFRATGKFIKRIIESSIVKERRGLAVSGVQVEFNKESSDFRKILSLKINGNNIDLNKEYLCVTTDYLMEGNSGLSLLTEVAEQEATLLGIRMHEALEDYIKFKSPLKIKSDGRWLRNNSEQIADYLQ
jgi:5'-nucleotidase / UDP-sugar diphosphatase